LHGAGHILAAAKKGRIYYYSQEKLLSSARLTGKKTPTLQTVQTSLAKYSHQYRSDLRKQTL